jgi:cysteine desulfurase / selenocysteine lyase
MREIYADHAATTFPRPPQVAEAVSSYLNNIGCSPGRGGYRRALEAARLVYDTRTNLARFFNVPQPEQVVFTPSVTYALNLIFKGILKRGDHVITSSMEHNAVVRPLERLSREEGVAVEYLPCAADGALLPQQVKDALCPQTRLVVLTHASNVTGTLLPVYEVGEILAKSDVLYAVDVAQTAGGEPVDFTALHSDFLAFTGHKGLLGPPGIGGLCFSTRAVEQTAPLVEGGTGSRSEMTEQPDFLPDKFESGTQNVPGVAGLGAGLGVILQEGLEKLHAQKTALFCQFRNGLKGIPEINVYGPAQAHRSTATISLNVPGLDNGDLSYILEQGYGIMTRSGLHCAPLAHQTIGTFPVGTLRFSFGYGNTSQDVSEILDALREVVREKTA